MSNECCKIYTLFGDLILHLVFKIISEFNSKVLINDIDILSYNSTVI